MRQFVQFLLCWGAAITRLYCLKATRKALDTEWVHAASGKARLNFLYSEHAAIGYRLSALNGGDDMNKYWRVLLGSLFLLIIMVVPPAAAVPIPIGTTAADDIILNFDFSSSVLPPPYHPVIVAFATGGRVSPLNNQVLTFDVFGGLNATEPFTQGRQFLTVNTLASGTTFNNNPFLGDGIFSVGFRISSGALDLIDLTATVHTVTGASDTIDLFPPTVVPIPEPAGFALLGIGLAALGIARRRAPG
jgi:hypothetical protein